MINKRRVFLFLLIILAAFLRLYRIEVLTEFLGDQGRTGIIIWNAWTTKTLPLVGPPVLTGQFLGPFFYYFIGLPFILSGFHPLASALFMAFFGVLSVYLIFYLGEKLFGFWIGIAMASLYAVSPYIVSSDRTLWEPNIIPFFVLSYIFCIYSIYQKRKFSAFFLMGIIVGILVQLHYPNIFFIVLSGLFWVYILATRKKQESTLKILLWSFWGIIGFLLVLSPFLYYESHHAWQDVKEIVLIFLVPTASGADTKPVQQILFDLSSRVFYKVIPASIQYLNLMGIVEFVILGIAFLQKKFWSIFFAFWFTIGILAMSFYHGTVFDHYLQFLLPVPFFLLGGAMFFYKQKISSTTLAFIIVVILISQLRNTDIFSKENNDIVRTSRMISEVISMTNNEPFSFTLISSRSFSDLHYRYFFTTRRRNPVPIINTSYGNLFLVCEKTPCVSPQELERIGFIQALCYEDHCGGPYPTIDLRAWQFVTHSDVLDGRIYMYKRKSFGGT